jgi:tetratricopeptide (TPR) repeat protein
MDKQTSSASKDAVPRQRINMQMVQNVLLIWLDNKIDDNSADCRNTIARLRRAITTINTFTDDEACIQFLENLHNDKACIIISGAFGQNMVPRVHSMPQLDSIFIFCNNKQYHEQWAKDWSKIKGVFTEISLICEALKEVAEQCEQDAIPLSFMATSDDLAKKNLDQLDPSFMYTTVMKEILLVIPFEQQHFMEFIHYCREALADNEGELKNLKKFERKYRDESPIWWYTYDCFLYPMLNRALRLMDVDVIIKMGFFIGDLHRYIQELHREQFGSQKSDASFTVYRGQGISQADFEQLTKTKGGLMSFNNFLSTSKDQEVSLRFARRALPNQDMVGILFVMTIDPVKSTIPFASITDVSYFKKAEEEVLFAMNTVFRIGEITPMAENSRLFQVELTPTSDNDQDLRRLTDCIREGAHPDVEGWYRLGSVLLDMGQSEKAQQVYEILLAQASGESAKASIYVLLGSIKNRQGEYQKSIRFYQEALEIYEKTRPLNYRDLGNSYNHIGGVYSNMGDYLEALSSHQKALKIQQQSLPPNHPDLAVSYNHIGRVYYNMDDYSKALSYCEKALAIQQQSLPPNHPDLGSCYNNIGSVYDEMGDYSTALFYYEKDLEISQKTLPPSHPYLAVSYNNIGLVYYNMSDYSKALSYYEKALAIQQQSLPPNHPDVGSSYNNIGSMYDEMGDYSKACPFYERAVEIKQHSLPPNHPKLQKCKKNLEDVKKKL